MPVIETPGISTAPSFRIRLARETYTSLLLSDIYTDFARGGRSDLFCNKKRAFASFDRFRSTPEPRSNTCPAKSTPIKSPELTVLWIARYSAIFSLSPAEYREDANNAGTSTSLIALSLSLSLSLSLPPPSSLPLSSCCSLGSNNTYYAPWILREETRASSCYRRERDFVIYYETHSINMLILRPGKTHRRAYR